MLEDPEGLLRGFKAAAPAIDIFRLTIPLRKPHMESHNAPLQWFSDEHTGMNEDV